MNVEDEVGGRTIRVLDPIQHIRGTAADEGTRALEVCPGKQDHLRVRSRFTNGGDDRLHGGSPLGNIDFPRLVHDAHGNLGRVRIPASKLTPEVGELFIARSTLSDDAAVPSGVVVDINDAGRPCVEARLH